MKTYQQKKDMQMMNIGSAIETEVFGLKKVPKTRTRTKKVQKSVPKSKSRSSSKSSEALSRNMDGLSVNL
jgi:hypothetical protein